MKIIYYLTAPVRAVRKAAKWLKSLLEEFIDELSKDPES